MPSVCTQFKFETVLFYPLTRRYQVLPLGARVNRGARSMKGYPALPKTSALLEAHHPFVLCHIQDTCCGGSYAFVEMHSVYSTAQVDCARSFGSPLLLLLRSPLIPKAVVLLMVMIMRHTEPFNAHLN